MPTTLTAGSRPGARPNGRAGASGRPRTGVGRRGWRRRLRATLVLVALGATLGTVAAGGGPALAAEASPVPGAPGGVLPTAGDVSDGPGTDGPPPAEAAAPAAGGPAGVAPAAGAPAGGAPAGGAPTAGSAWRRADLVVEATAGIAAELSTVAVTSRPVREAEWAVRAGRADVDAALADQASAVAEIEQLQRDIDALDLDRIALDAEQAARRQRQQDHQALADGHLARAARAKDMLQALAASAYVGAGSEPVALESPTVTDGTRRSTYRRNLLEIKEGELVAESSQGRAAQAEADAAGVEVAEAEETAAGLDAARAANRAESVAAEGRRQEAATREQSRREHLAWAEAELAEARRTAAVDGLDLTLVVLDALWNASRTMAVERPDCRLTWPLLAAISRVESGHGRFGVSSVDRNGEVQPRIRGPALDGQQFALIPDSDGGALDGDATVDRAVGPMQFIPSSWALFGRDGNRDGGADPDNYYDAALAAAEHLCRAGADTSTEAGLRAAVLGYNASEDYLRSVAAQALAYARFPLGG